MIMNPARRIIPRLFDAKKKEMPKVPPASNAPKPRLRNGIYILPALFTLGNMSMGFYALVQTVSQNFGHAAVAILWGHVLDILDGRVARWTKTTSRFGVELDSLADWLTFCIAPSFLMYELVLKENRLWGFPLALLFVICGSLRLSRFNLKAQMGEEKSTYFSGLPSPAAGGALAIIALLYYVVEADKPIRSFKVLMNHVPLIFEYIPVIMLILSLLMVSEVRFSTLKQMNLMRPRTMRGLVLIVLMVMMIYIYPQNTLFILYTSYILWGLLEHFLGRSWPKILDKNKLKNETE